MFRQQSLHSVKQIPYHAEMITHQISQSPSKPLSSHRKQSSQKNIDIEKLIGNVKITPNKDLQYQRHITNIRKELQSLGGFPQIYDQLRTVDLLLNSIVKKLTIDNMSLSRSVCNTAKKSQQRIQQVSGKSISPIKQFQDVNIPIVYTNFSLKEVPQTTVPYSQPNLETPVKKNMIEDEETKEINRLNKEILMLQNILKTKGVEQRISNRKHLGIVDLNTETATNQKLKYMQSETLCPQFKKNKHQSIHEKRAPSRKNSIKHMQQRFR